MKKAALTLDRNYKAELTEEFASHGAGAKTAADLSGWEGRLYRRYQA